MSTINKEKLIEQLNEIINTLKEEEEKEKEEKKEEKEKEEKCKCPLRQLCGPDVNLKEYLNDKIYYVEIEDVKETISSEGCVYSNLLNYILLFLFFMLTIINIVKIIRMC